MDDDANGLEEAPHANGNIPSKRKSDDGDQRRTRAKRNRYISIACNECKRRKIKCNGQTPCQRCGNLNLECVYAPNCCNNFKESEEFQQMTSHISTLQQQVETLFANLNFLRSQVDTAISTDSVARASGSVSSPGVGSATHGAMSRPPRFHGPTSSAFNLGVAKTSLRNIGITGSEDVPGEQQHHDRSPGASPPPIHSMPAASSLHDSKDPIWSITREEATRLVQSWKEHVYTMYPIVDINNLMQHIDQLYTFMEGAQRTGLVMTDLPGADAISDVETNKLKLILASAITMESNGPSELGEKLFRSVADRVESLLLQPPGLRNIEQMMLAAVYAFHRDDEILAWRLLGLAGRMGLELGLHKQTTYLEVLQSHTDRYRATILLWTIYVLDRRWSFGTGLPFVIQENDIDPMLLRPDAPYLSNMIDLTAISSKIWPRIANIDPGRSDFNAKEMETLDYEVLQWYHDLDPNLKYDPRASPREHPTNDSTFRIRVLLYLRANQTRILIGRPLFMSTSAIMDNLTYADNVIRIAQDTIRILRTLNQTTSYYRSQQVLWNYFLISALAALFLAVAHAPAQFSSACRDEFYMALDLVRGMSTNSFIGRRLWRTIKVLKEVGPMIGLTASQSEAAEATSAAHTMAIMAGSSMDRMSAPMMPTSTPSAVTAGEGWENMTADLTNLYESAMDAQEGGPADQTRYLAHQDGLSRAFRDLF